MSIIRSFAVDVSWWVVSEGEGVRLLAERCERVSCWTVVGFLRRALMNVVVPGGGLGVS